MAEAAVHQQQLGLSLSLSLSLSEHFYSMHLSVSSTHMYFGLHWNTLLFSNCLSSCPCFDADNNVNNQTRQNSAIIFIRGARPNLWIILTFLKKSKNPSLNKQTSLQYCWLGGADIKGGGALGRRGGWQGGVGRGGVNSGRSLELD